MSPLAIALVVESLALVIALGFLTLRGAPASPTPATQPSETKPAVDADAESARRSREIAEARAQIAELREQIKRLKRERYDQRQAEKGSQALLKEREHVERTASQQLEAVRDELAQALGDVSRLKAELDLHRTRKAPQTQPPPLPQPARPIEAAAEAEGRSIRSLERLEQRAVKDRARAIELEKELKRFRSKADMHSRLYLVVKGELELSRDKYKALEKRLNRTLLERDLLVRAIRQLERESGKVAERTELTAEEMAASDAETEAVQREEAEALATSEPEAPKANA